MAVVPRYSITTVQQALLVLLVQGVDVDVRVGLGLEKVGAVAGN